MEKVREAINLLSSALSEKPEESSSCSSSSFGTSRGSTVSASSNSAPGSSKASSSSSCVRGNSNASASSSCSSEWNSCSSESNKSRAISACSQALNALTHLKQMRMAEQRANFQSYRENDNKRSKRASTDGTSVATPSKTTKLTKSVQWSRKFVCLASTVASKVPSSTEKCFLASVGLGEKVIKFPSMQVMLDEFQDIIKWNFTQLEESGGFDLLKCKPNSRELEAFPFMVTYPIPRIQHHVPNGRVYIRPLQNDLKLGDDNEVDWVIQLANCFCSNVQ